MQRQLWPVCAWTKTTTCRCFFAEKGTVCKATGTVHCTLTKLTLPPPKREVKMGAADISDL